MALPYFLTRRGNTEKIPRGVEPSHGELDSLLGFRNYTGLCTFCWSPVCNWRLQLKKFAIQSLLFDSVFRAWRLPIYPSGVYVHLCVFVVGCLQQLLTFWPVIELDKMSQTQLNFQSNYNLSLLTLSLPRTERNFGVYFGFNWGRICVWQAEKSINLWHFICKIATKSLRCANILPDPFAVGSTSYS